MTLTEYDEAKVMKQFKEEGVEIGKVQMLRLMLQNKMTLPDISKATGIPVEKIKAMLENTKAASTVICCKIATK